MAELQTKFAGLELRNPFIVSSSGLTDSPAKNRALEEAGAAAVVLKSVFEEQILLSAGQVPDNGYGEGADYLVNYIRSHQLAEYISLIRETRKQCTIPVIASINCHTDSEWAAYAGLFEEAGADALEINLLSLQTAKDYRPGSFEELHVSVLQKVKAAVRIPVIFKLGTNLTAPVALADRLQAHGAAGVVLFNRLYQPDIDVDGRTLTTANVFSTPADLPDRLRWTAILTARVPALPVALSGGVHDGDALIKALLAGASAVEVCSALYRGGNEVIRGMLDRLDAWCGEHGFAGIPDFRGMLNARESGAEDVFERTQFMRYYSSRNA